MRAYIHTYIHTYTCTYVYVYVFHIYIYIYMYTYTMRIHASLSPYIDKYISLHGAELHRRPRRKSGSFRTLKLSLLHVRLRACRLQDSEAFHGSGILKSELLLAVLAIPLGPKQARRLTQSKRKNINSNWKQTVRTWQEWRVFFGRALIQVDLQVEMALGTATSKSASRHSPRSS